MEKKNCYTCIPKRICLIVIEGFQSSSSFKIDKHTVPKEGIRIKLEKKKKKIASCAYIHT